MSLWEKEEDNKIINRLALTNENKVFSEMLKFNTVNEYDAYITEKSESVRLYGKSITIRDVFGKFQQEENIEVLKERRKRKRLGQLEYWEVLEEKERQTKKKHWDDLIAIQRRNNSAMCKAYNAKK